MRSLLLLVLRNQTICKDAEVRGLRSAHRRDLQSRRQGDSEDEEVGGGGAVTWRR
jgi:hypothetical protein